MTLPVCSLGQSRVVGILLAVGARRRASKAVTECTALIQGCAG
jgi:hypothetical protein